ncbi:methyl-accepting chemotaxis protein, partial [Campylobacter sp. B0100352/1]|uniref:cache domain-containing protein n=1 Tax=Campylobacter sp. B0100352/1 TaxID=2735783 RepID=UPI001D5FFFE0|nr:methyl-accepting chemotaxis protein [Campylobacter sp. B0100352/1]
MQTNQNKSSFKVSTKLTLIVGFFILLVLAITTIVSYQQSKSTAFELLQDTQLKTMDDVKVSFDAYASMKRRIIDVLAKNLNDNPNMSMSDILVMLEVIKHSTEFDAVYIGYEDTGKLIMSDGTILDSAKGYDARNANWYKQAKQAGKLIVTRPYKSVTDGKINLAYAAPLYKDGKLIGVVGADYNVEKFSHDVLASGKSAHSYASVYDVDGNIAFNEDQTKLLTKNTLSINIQKTLAQDSKLLDPNVRDTLFFADNDKGETQAIMCNPSSINPIYRICSVVNKKTYDSIIDKIFYSQIIVGIIALAI